MCASKNAGLGVLPKNVGGLKEVQKKRRKKVEGLRVLPKDIGGLK